MDDSAACSFSPAAVAADIMLFDNCFDGIEDGVRIACATSSGRCWKRSRTKLFTFTQFPLSQWKSICKMRGHKRH
jgi:hypothetical protein